MLPQGREATLADLTRGFVLDYRRSRTRATGGRKRLEVQGENVSPATLNRDLAALGAFLTWIRDVEGLTVERVRMPRERESRGRERWLSPEELARFAAHCPADWWPFFATLFYTGARLGEAQGLRGGDVLLHAKRLLIHEGSRRVKTKEAIRDLPIAPPLEHALAGHLARVGPGPDDLVFPDDTQVYGKVQRTWAAICRAAEVAGATPHDARHTFAVRRAGWHPDRPAPEVVGARRSDDDHAVHEARAGGLPGPGRRGDRGSHDGVSGSRGGGPGGGSAAGPETGMNPKKSAPNFAPRGGRSAGMTGALLVEVVGGDEVSSNRALSSAG
ncbi:MAG: tyrosine-type recombinase/integrase [Gemmatimonadales bacterium]|nr:tyrosine-type recombinase/integrase [Gemmatimonadales bacterium]